jgi:hypothetical protein
VINTGTKFKQMSARDLRVGDELLIADGETAAVTRSQPIGAGWFEHDAGRKVGVRLHGSRQVYAIPKAR